MMYSHILPHALRFFLILTVLLKYSYNNNDNSSNNPKMRYVILTLEIIPG